MGVLTSLIDRSISGSFYSETAIVGDYAFYGCNNLTSIHLPCARNISGNAFQNMSNVTTISLPSLANIKTGQFTKLSNLSNLELPMVTSIDLPTVGGGAFPEVNNDGAFHGCTSLTYLSLPVIKTLAGAIAGTNFAKVRYSVFRGSSLTTISLPTIDTIGAYAFCDCSTLRILYVRTGMKGSNICTLENTNAFPSSTITTIYVPASLVDSYKSATNWSEYANKIMAAP